MSSTLVNSKAALKESELTVRVDDDNETAQQSVELPPLP
jgi:hypothetical protein